MRKISIITVVYNAHATIEDCIHSVIQQSYPEIEYIVTEGQPPDGTVDVIQQYATHIDLFISEKDNGVYDAMNNGLQRATGDIIGFLNADDMLATPETVADLAGAFSEHGVDSCFGDVVYVDPIHLHRAVRYWKAQPFTPHMFYHGVVPPHPTFYATRTVHRKYGGFNVEFTLAADFELMLRFLVKYHLSTSYIPHTIVKMRANGASNKNWRNMITGLFECYQAFSSNALPVSVAFIPKSLRFKLQQVK